MKTIDLQAEWDLSTVKCSVGEADDFIAAIREYCWCDKMTNCTSDGPCSLRTVKAFKRMIFVRRDLERWQRGEQTR